MKTLIFPNKPMVMLMGMWSWKRMDMDKIYCTPQVPNIRKGKREATTWIVGCKHVWDQENLKQGFSLFIDILIYAFLCVESFIIYLITSLVYSIWKLCYSDNKCILICFNVRLVGQKLLSNMKNNNALSQVPQMSMLPYALSAVVFTLHTNVRCHKVVVKVQ